MATVITQASTVLCDTASGNHGGKVGVSGTPKLTVSGNPVLLSNGVASKSVSTCQTQQTNSTKPCTTVSAVSGGVATKLKVGGQGVLTEELSGSTDGNPTGALAATAEHQKLTAR